MDSDSELESSELGTKEYWDKAYTLEIKNFNSHKDVGEIWFGEGSMWRVANYLQHCHTVTYDSLIVDVGCGNGMFLIELACDGYKNLIGLDYSLQAIELAQLIAKDKNMPITYKVADLAVFDFCHFDFLADVCHDKGTYDAISLCSESPNDKRNQYLRNTYHMLKGDGQFIITSCNWTQEELVKQFSKYFVLKEVLPTPTFKFGSKTGSLVTALVFSKQKDLSCNT